MRRPDWSLTLSLLIHAGILISAVVVLPQAKLPPVEDRPPISVEIVEIKEKSERVATRPDAPKVPETPPAPPKAEPVPEKPKAAIEPPPEPEPEPVPKEPAPQDVRKLEELVKQAEQKPVAKPAPPTPRPKPPKPPEKKPKKELKVEELAALLNKLPDQPQPVEASQTDGVPTKSEIEQLLGKDGTNSADLIDYLSQATSKCWSPPTGVAEAQDLVISLKIQFARDGAVVGTPEVMNRSGNPLFGVASVAAVRAVLICAPYDKLPRDRYEEWRETQINFNPANMFAP